MLGKPYFDVRIERPYLWDWIGSMPGLMSIDLLPPASGPEIELTFGTAEGSDPVREDYLAMEVERITKKQVLALRVREE